MIIKKLTPDLIVDSLLDIPLEKLMSKNIKGMIIDLDNTITEWNNPEIKRDICHWFHVLPDYGITPCLLSNNKGPRVMAAAKKLGIFYVANATKPRRRGFLQAMALLNTTSSDPVVVGDQIFTDVFGGKRAGLYTILVSPLSKKEFIGTKFTRMVERIALKKIKRITSKELS